MKEQDLRKLQQIELSILNDVATFCDNNNITYYLSSGTLLGAVRHKGFIPWDDDVDIDMPYEDYKKFINIASEELSNKYFVQTFETDKNFQRAHAKIRLNGTTLLEKDLKKYYIHQGVWIDIFPLAPINKGIDFKLKKAIVSISNYCQAENYINASKDVFEELLGKKKIRMMRIFYSLFSEKKRIWLHRFLLNRVFCSSHNCPFLTEVWAGITDIYPKEVFEGKRTELLFENKKFRVPPHWEEYLEIQYGNYMELPPESKRVNHNVSIVDFEKDYSEYLEYD